MEKAILYRTAESVVAAIEAGRNDEQAKHLMRFFKTGKGEYGEGDLFLGLKVPQTRAVVSRSEITCRSEIETLLASGYHEIRLAALLITAGNASAEGRAIERITKKLSAAAGVKRSELAKEYETRSRVLEEWVMFYLKNAERANNWDLVDLSSYPVISPWLMLPENREYKIKTLDAQALSDNLWRQRIAVIGTLGTVRNNEFSFALRYCEMLIGHSHDLIHKAVGWTLREIGKKDIETLRGFLKEHYGKMHRTTLRYAIERMDKAEKEIWMKRSI